jgi:curved DNA-binding protein CbpA
MRTIYEILGIPRDATESVIRAAKRRYAAENHPDKGGDAEAFGAAMASVDLLLDPQRRLVYDKTGRMNWQPPQEADVMNFILDTIVASIDKYSHTGGINWINLVKQRAGDEDSKRVEVKNQAMGRSIKFRTIAQRVRRKSSGPNVLATMFEDVAVKLEGLAEEAELARRLPLKVIEFLLNYEMDMSPEQRSAFEGTYLGAGFGGQRFNF